MSQQEDDNGEAKRPKVAALLPFDPTQHGLEASFRLTDYAKLKG